MEIMNTVDANVIHDIDGELYTQSVLDQDGNIVGRPSAVAAGTGCRCCGTVSCNQSSSCGGGGGGGGVHDDDML